MPITVGVFRRVIILPQRFVHETNLNVLGSAIGHELVHVVRRDYLTNLICEFIYVPLVSSGRSVSAETNQTHA